MKNQFSFIVGRGPAENANILLLFYLLGGVTNHSYCVN